MKKCEKVINSCETLDQLKVAEKYYTLYNKRMLQNARALSYFGADVTFYIKRARSVNACLLRKAKKISADFHRHLLKKNLSVVK